MKRPEWQIEFESSEFLPCLPEDSQVNPGTYGFELAFWLSQMLASRGIAVSYPQDDDWGWFIDTVDADGETTVTCLNVGEEGSGYVGKPLTWGVVVRPHRSSLRQVLRGEWPLAAFSRVTQAIAAVLTEKGIAVREVKSP